MEKVMLATQTNIEGINFSDGMHPPGFKPFTKELLIKIVDQISKNCEVRKIILFGSYAYPDNTPTPDSDIDILIVMETNMERSKRILSIVPLLHPYHFPMDIIIRTPLEIFESLEKGDLFIREIMEKGRIIYT
jgi:predicted nucleotidyltransferase